MEIEKMMKNKILFMSLICISFLFAQSGNKDKEKFIDKYLKKDEYNQNKKDAEQFRKNISTDVNIDEMSKRDRKDIDTKIEKNKNEKKAKDIAAEIRTQVETKSFKNKVQKFRDYIFKDKNGFNFDEKIGIYKNEIKNAKKANYENKFLASDERLIIAISSSIPNNVIKNYFKDLENVNTDVVFVLNGFVGNERKIRPTINYITNLLSKSKNEKDKYLFKIDINPKIFTKYNIKNVPAVLFVKNYNPYSEMQGILKKDENEKVYISYGDAKIKYVLEKIQKDAKSKNLEKFIKNMNKGFFNE